MPAALPSLLWFALLLFSFAFVWTVRKQVEAMFGPLISLLQKLPGLGGALASLLETIERGITNALGSAEHAIDKGIGASFHFLARQTDWLWHQFTAHAGALLQIATYVSPFGNIIAMIRDLLHHSSRGHSQINAQIKTLNKELGKLRRELRTLEHDVSKGIGEDVLPKIRSLERELDRIENKTIPALRGAEQAAEGEIGNLWEWVKDNVPVAGTDAFTAATVAALSAVGLSGLFCRSNPIANNRNACNWWTDLADLLALATAVFAVTDFEEMVHEMQAVEGAVVGAAKDLFGLD